MCTDWLAGCNISNDIWLERQEYPNFILVYEVPKINICSKEKADTSSLVGAMVPTSSKELKLHLNSPKPKWRPELESQMFSLLCMGRSHPPDVRLESQRARQQEMVTRKRRQWVFIRTGCLALWWEMSEPWVNLCSEEGAPGCISLSSFLEGRSEREPILVYQTLQLSTLILSTAVDSAQ